MILKSPYNFVPISDKVYFPDWAHQVSHDVPFSDSLNGELIINIIAESPIFIKNGENNSFSGFNNLFFIPGSSVKGMIRSVLEIISFGKLKPIDDRQYSWRDLYNKAYSSRFTSGFNSEPNVQAGFIKQNGDDWYLIPAKMARIEQCELDKDFGADDDLLSAPDKYNFWKQKKKKLNAQFNITKPRTDVFKKQCGKFKRAKLSNSGEKEGTLVFTGQIRKREKVGEGKHGEKNKHLEFVFYDKNEKMAMPIDKNMKRDFKLNHSSERNIDNHKLALAPNNEWAFWNKKISDGKMMPVFWLPKKDGTIDSFGLSMLYRLPYKYSICDLLPTAHKSDQLDLPEIIFGTTSDKIKLKGRVQFSMAKTIGGAEELEERTVVLSSPKATFYPNYIRQTNKKYLTYDDSSAVLAGRKRYPIHNNSNPIDNSNPKMNNVASKIKPLAKGTMFKFKIRYHNLRPIEFGALLSALTFHNHNKELFHSIGMGKPLGYGKIKVNSIISCESPQNLINYMILFEKEMDVFLGDNGPWCKSESIVELFTMASESSADTSLKYMALDDYTEVKTNREYLKKYSDIVKSRLHLKSLIDNDINDSLTKSTLKQKIKKTLTIAESDKVKNMTKTQFKKYLKAKTEAKECDGSLFNIYDTLKGTDKAQFIDEQLNKQAGKIHDYLIWLEKKYDKKFK